MQKIKSFCGRPFDFVKLDQKLFPDREYRLQYEYSTNRSYLYIFIGFVFLLKFHTFFSFFCRFDDESDGYFFSQATRISVVHFILERQPFSHEDESSNNIGIEKLLNECIYSAAYPLHDVSKLF